MSYTLLYLIMSYSTRQSLTWRMLYWLCVIPYFWIMGPNHLCHIIVYRTTALCSIVNCVNVWVMFHRLIRINQFRDSSNFCNGIKGHCHPMIGLTITYIYKIIYSPCEWYLRDNMSQSCVTEILMSICGLNQITCECA